MYDIQLGTGGIAAQFDDDGYGTLIEWYAVTPWWIVEEIERLVDEGKVAPELKKSLTAKIENALTSIEKGKSTPAARKLRAFINEVEAQEGHKIAGDAAFMLINYALNLIAQHEGGG